MYFDPDVGRGDGGQLNGGNTASRFYEWKSTFGWQQKVCAHIVCVYTYIFFSIFLAVCFEFVCVVVNQSGVSVVSRHLYT